MSWRVNGRSLVVLLALTFASVVAFIVGGYHERAGLIFVASYVILVLFILWGASGIDSRSITSLSVVSILTGGVVEYIMSTAGLWEYPNGVISLLFPAFGWNLLMIAMLVVARVLDRFLQPIPPGKGVKSVLPSIVGIALMVSFQAVGGYLEVVDWTVVATYSVMALASIYYTLRHSLRWNVALMISALMLGAGMEATGSFEGLFQFWFSEILPIYLPFAWTLNTWTVHALCMALGVDFEEAPPVRQSDSSQVGRHPQPL